MQHFGKGALRVAKNYTKGYSDTQAKVRDATSNDAWGPSGTQMNEIAQMTYNQADFVEIVEILHKRLNDKGKNWRHVFKSLTVVDYCLHAGSESVVMFFRDSLYLIKTLKEFQYVDEDGKDQGANVRQKAKDITNLLQDEGRLRDERRTRAHMRERMIRGGHTDEPDIEDENSNRRNRNGPPRGRRSTRDRDEEELQRAIEESKKSHQQHDSEEQDLEKAIKLSQEEEARRNKAVEDSNAASLFDDQSQIPSPSSGNNPFPFVDPTPYATSLQPQFTQIQPQLTQLHPQFTAFNSFNPYQQQAQQEAMQAEFLRQQQEWMQQQQQQQQQQQLQEAAELWTRQQQQLQQQQSQQLQSVLTQPTGFGSNNPFAPASNIPPVPSFPNNSQNSLPSFNLPGTFANNNTDSGSSTSFSPSPSFSPAPSSAPSLPSSSQRQPTKADQTHSHLASLVANREDGQDTFGNIGLLRYGGTDAGRSLIQSSSHNPFSLQQQQQLQQSNSQQPFFEI